MDLMELLHWSVESKASDVHVSAGISPRLRLDGVLQEFPAPVFDQEPLLNMLSALMSEDQRSTYQKELEVDFAFELDNLARFRVHVYSQARGIAAAFRVLPTKILSMEDLCLPAVLRDLADSSWGLVLITGPSGSGKSTTLAAMLDYINYSSSKHIITLEDPIEFVHQSKRSLINQREVGKNTLSFSHALRSALREDPDVILVGELRDLESMRLAITAAETGHLVLASLHTNSATKTIHRIIDLFPGEEKATIRSLLSESLQAVVAQNLLQKLGGGRVAAWEIMRCNSAIRHLIREDKIAQMYSSIQTGQLQGMHTLDQNLAELLHKNIIARQTAQEVAINKALF